MIFLTLAVGVLLSQAPTAEAAASTPRGMAVSRLYLGGAAGAQGSNQVGEGGVVGFQSFNEITPSTASFWGIELLGVRAGAGVLPIVTGDFGLRWAPLPYFFLKPYVTANLGLSLLIIVPVPSVALGVGVAVPLGDAIRIDLGLRARYALNIFDTSNSVTIGTLELGLGF